MAGAMVVFLILVGTVTFDAWPRAAGLLEDGIAKVAGAVGLGDSDGSTSDQSPAPAVSPSKSDRVSGAAGGTQRSPDSGAPGGRQGIGRAPGGNVPSAGNGGGGSGGGGTSTQQGQQQQSGGSTSQPSRSGPLAQTIQNTTTALNTTVSNTTTTLNNTLSGVTNTLDQTVGGLLGGK